MKSLTLAALLVVALCALPARSAAQQNDPTKCFQLEGTSDYDFGTVEPDQPVEHTFTFRNGCDSTIEIDAARASCGCTAAILSDKVIKPGDVAKIDVKFSPSRSMQGKVTKTVSVMLKGEANPHTVIRFTAKIKTDLELQPQYISLNGAEVGREISGTAMIANVSEKNIDLTDFSVSMTAYADTAGTKQTVAVPLTAARVEPATMSLKPGEKKEVKVFLTPKYAGQVNGSIRFKYDKAESMLQVFGIVRDASGVMRDDKSVVK
jgi:hypothetical protein